MDALDHLTGPAADLLTRVDDLLCRAGAPAGHPVWPLLRRLGALPGDAVAAVAALRAGPLTAAGPTLRDLAHRYADVAAPLTGDDRWQGAAGQAYDAARRGLAAHLDSEADSLTGRLHSTAGYADALADWVDRGRRAVARTLAEVLASAEAVTVTVGRAPTGVPGPALAAAEIAARVLGVVADVHAEGEELLRRWAPELGELPPPRATGGGGPVGVLRIRR
jgi:hypothetical protein